MAFIKSLKRIISTYHLTDIYSGPYRFVNFIVGTDKIGMGVRFYHSYDLCIVGSRKIIIRLRVAGRIY